MLRQMGHSSAVSLLAFTLCLFGCFYVSAATSSSGVEDTAVTKDEANQAVSDAKKAIKEVSDKAQDNIGNATLLLQEMEPFKQLAKDKADEAEKTGKDNQKAASIIEEIKRISSTVSTSHSSAEKELQDAIASMNEVLKEAQTLNTESNKEIKADSDPPTNYKGAKNEALGIKAKALKFNSNTSDALTIINRIRSTAVEMGKSAEDAQLKNVQVSGIVTGTDLETTIGEADSIIQTLNDKNEEVNGIVKEMLELKAKVTSKSPENIHELLQSTNDELSKATDVLEKTQQQKTDKTEQKQKANTALANVAKEKIVTAALKDVDTAKECVTQVKAIVGQLKSALETATASVTNAKNSKQKLVEALSRITTSKPSTEQTTATVKSNLPVGDGTGSHSKDTTTQPTITHTKQPTSKELHEQSNNSADKLKDALSKGAQNVPTTALTGGKAPAPGAKNDSAMTVSVPLLVALIASAVLQ